jgi:hypothetical protein
MTIIFWIKLNSTYSVLSQQSQILRLIMKIKRNKKKLILPTN